MNPYEVLGVSETATDEQVRSAYIKLVKKYHPDRYQDSDLKDLANDKLKQVNEAYDTITNMRKNGSASQNTYSGSGFGGYSGSSSRTSSGGYSGNYGSGYSGNFSAEFARVRQCINTSSLYEAQAILDGIPLHNAECIIFMALSVSAAATTPPPAIILTEPFRWNPAMRSTAAQGIP